jgi:hypothetical protein
MRRLPCFLHALTAMHAVGAGACFVMAVGSAASDNFRASLTVSGGSAIRWSHFASGPGHFLPSLGRCSPNSHTRPGVCVRGPGQ